MLRTRRNERHRKQPTKHLHVPWEVSTFARSMGCFSTELPLDTGSDPDSGSPRQPAAHFDSAPSSPEARSCPAVTTTKRLACLVSPGRSSGRPPYVVRQGSGIEEEACPLPRGG